MKKKILLTFFVFIICIFSFNNRVNGRSIMWLNCNYDESAGTLLGSTVYVNGMGYSPYNGGYYASRLILPDSKLFNRYAVINDTKNNPIIAIYTGNYGINSSEGDGGNAWYGSDIRDYLYFYGTAGADVNKGCFWFKNLADITQVGESTFSADRILGKYELYDNCYGNILRGICPGIVRPNNSFIGVERNFLIAAGTGTTVSSNYLDDDEYIIYSFSMTVNGAKETAVIAEGYTNDGRYAWFGNDTNDNYIYQALDNNIKTYSYVFSVDPISSWIFTRDGDKFSYRSNFVSWSGLTQYLRLLKHDPQRTTSQGGANDYFKLSKGYDYTLLSIAFPSEETKNSFKVLYSSADSQRMRTYIMDEWYSKEVDSGKAKEQKEASDRIESNTNLLKYSQEIYDEPNQNISFSGYSASQMVNDLDSAYNDISILNSETPFREKLNDGSTKQAADATSSAYSYFMYDTFGRVDHTNFKSVANGRFMSNIIANALTNSMEELEKEGKILVDYNAKIEKYLQLFTTAAMYLDSKAGFYDLSTEERSIISSLSKNYQELASKHGIYPVVDCQSLLGNDFIEKINSYLDIIKIAIPILLILLGIVDFVKALFAGDEEQMNSAQKTFIKRIGIAVLIFLSPIIVNLILNIANHVWDWMTPNSCGIFS